MRAILLVLAICLGLLVYSDTSKTSDLPIARAEIAQVETTIKEGPLVTITPRRSTTTTTTRPTTTTTAPRTTTTSATPRHHSDPRMQKIYDVYHARVPQHWKNRIQPKFRIRSGSTSVAYTNMVIEISEYHVNSSREYLAVIITHEFGHLIAYRYGTQEYLGAPPKGWPPRTNRPQEHWSDCVQASFMGYNNPTRGLPPCEGRQLSWARDYLAR